MGDRLPRIKIGRALLWLHHATAHEISDARVMSRRSKATVLCGAHFDGKVGGAEDTARTHERDWLREHAQMAGRPGYRPSTGKNRNQETRVRPGCQEIGGERKILSGIRRQNPQPRDRI